MVEAEPLPPLSAAAGAAQRAEQYTAVLERLELLLLGEGDWVAAMATVACNSSMLVIGPYQGGLGCLRIPYTKGVCGAAARTRQTQLVPDVHAFPGHIACASSTLSEVVVPVVTPDGRLLAVLDVDSDLPAAFTTVDAEQLQRLCGTLGARQWKAGL